MDSVIDSTFNPIDYAMTFVDDVGGDDSEISIESTDIVENSEANDIEAEGTEISETVETVEVDDRNIMTTPFSEYTVTEGLLLILVLCVIASGVYGFIRRCV